MTRMQTLAVASRVAPRRDVLSAFLFLMVIVVCCGCGRTRIEVVALGDSITNGYGSSTHGEEFPGYQGLLRNKLERFFGAVNMSNRAGGDIPSREGLAKVKEVAVGRGGYLLILYGTIDLHRGLSKREVVENLQEMVGIAKGNGLIPIIGTLPPDPAHDSDSEPNDVSLLNELIREMARKEGVVLADHHVAFRGNPALLFEGAHPNDAGYEIMAEVWAQAIFNCFYQK